MPRTRSLSTHQRYVPGASSKVEYLLTLEGLFEGISTVTATSLFHVVVVVEILMNYYVWNSLKTKLIVVEAPYKGTIYILLILCVILQFSNV